MPLAKLMGGDGYPIIINPDHVIFVSQAMLKGTNGAASLGLQPAVGKCMVQMDNGAQIAVDGTIEAVYAQLRKPDPHAVSDLNSRRIVGDA